MGGISVFHGRKRLHGSLLGVDVDVGVVFVYVLQFPILVLKPRSDTSHTYLKHQVFLHIIELLIQVKQVTTFQHIQY